MCIIPIIKNTTLFRALLNTLGELSRDLIKRDRGSMIIKMAAKDAGALMLILVNVILTKVCLAESESAKILQRKYDDVKEALLNSIQLAKYGIVGIIAKCVSEEGYVTETVAPKKVETSSKKMINVVVDGSDYHWWLNTANKYAMLVSMERKGEMFFSVDYRFLYDHVQYNWACFNFDGDMFSQYIDITNFLGRTPVEITLVMKKRCKVIKALCACLTTCCANISEWIDDGLNTACQTNCFNLCIYEIIQCVHTNDSSSEKEECLWDIISSMNSSSVAGSLDYQIPPEPVRTLYSISDVMKVVDNELVDMVAEVNNCSMIEYRRRELIEMIESCRNCLSHNPFQVTLILILMCIKYNIGMFIIYTDRNLTQQLIIENMDDDVMVKKGLVGWLIDESTWFNAVHINPRFKKPYVVLVENNHVQLVSLSVLEVSNLITEPAPITITQKRIVMNEDNM